MAKRRRSVDLVPNPESAYTALVSGISELLDRARRAAVRAVNSFLTATYWEVGRRIVEFEQGGKARADYGEALLNRLGRDLTAKLGRGFSERNLLKMRAFYLGWAISPTPSAKLEARAMFPDPAAPTLPLPLVRQPLDLVTADLIDVFPLPWSHYVRLLSVDKPHARAFYEAEAIRGGWSVRQLDRQISTRFYERTAHSKRQAALLARGQQPQPEDAVTVAEEIRDPYLLEFLNLKDEYSESGLEEALIRHLEWFLLELGTGFTFVACQKRIRGGNRGHSSLLLTPPLLAAIAPRR